MDPVQRIVPRGCNHVGSHRKLTEEEARALNSVIFEQGFTLPTDDHSIRMYREDIVNRDYPLVDPVMRAYILTMREQTGNPDWMPGLSRGAPNWLLYYASSNLSPNASQEQVNKAGAARGSQRRGLQPPRPGHRRREPLQPPQRPRKRFYSHATAAR